MPHDPHLADLMRGALAGRRGVSERKMFGGYCWMLNGNMLCGVEVGRYMFRVGPELHAQALARPGASQRTMDSGSFRCELIGVGERGSVQRGRIAGRGDPGHRATTVFVCESALALARDAGKLPGGARFGGVLTPSTAFGAVLAGRLRAAGMTIEP